MESVRLFGRRAFLGFSLAGIPGRAQKGREFAPERRRYLDPATEFEVQRMTDPASSSVLPAHYQKALTRRGNALLFGSDRSGSFQAFLMDVKSSESRQTSCYSM